MNSSDERQFSARLSAVLDDYPPPPLQFDAVLTRGRAVKIRRRATAVLGALAVVAMAIAAPAAFAALTGPAQPTALAHYHVSVSPPGKGAGKGVIAIGRVGKLRWTASATYNARTTRLCFTAFGVTDCSTGAPLAPEARSRSLLLEQGVLSMQPILELWSVRSDVTRVAFSLSNGRTLMLRPVAVFGKGYPSYIALGTPSAASVTAISAYSASGEIRYAVPFTRNIGLRAYPSPGAEILTPRWLSPGQPARPSPAAYTIGSGAVNGQHWAEHLYLGPWGTCLDGAGYGGFCFGQEGVALLRGQPARRLATAYADRTTGYVAVIASRQVSYLKLRFAGGGFVKVTATHADGVSFAAYATSPARKVLNWTACTAAGTTVGEGT